MAAQSYGCDVTDIRPLSQLQILFVWVFITVQVAAGAQAVDQITPSMPTLQIEAIAVDVDGKALINVLFSSAGLTVTAVQFDITYDSKHVVFSALPSSGTISSGKHIWEYTLNHTATRILVAGLNQNPINDGVLTTLWTRVTPGTPPGLYSLAIHNIVAADSTGYSVRVSGTGGSTVVPGNGILAPVILSVSNAASYVSGAVAPGEIVVIGGSSLGPKTIEMLQLTSAGSVSTLLPGTRALFDGIPAPLIYATEEQVSAIVPYGLDGRLHTSVQVESHGIRSAPVILPVISTSPAIFTLNQSGTGQGVIVNEDGTMNGSQNPASRGSVVSIYGTGEGQTVPPGIDGLIVGSTNLRRPLLESTVWIGEQNAEVLYLGSAGSQVSGLFQANVRVPLSVAPGDAVPVTIRIDRSTQPGVTIAVK